MEKDKKNINAIIQGQEPTTGFKECEGFKPGEYVHFDTSIVRQRPHKSTFGMDTMMSAYLQSEGEDRKVFKKHMLNMIYGSEMTPDQMIDKYFESKPDVKRWIERINEAVIKVPDTAEGLMFAMKKCRPKSESQTLIMDYSSMKPTVKPVVSDDAYDAFAYTLKKIAKDMEEEKREGNSSLQSRPEIEGS